MLDKQKTHIKEIGLLFKEALIYKELFKNSLGEEKEIIWEKVGEIILNHIYGYNCENLNSKYKNNIDGIDLGDDNKSIGIQVSVTASAYKIRDTIKKYKKGQITLEDGKKVKLYEIYNHLKFFFIKESYNPNMTIDTEGKYQFDIKNDIITFNTIICDLGNKEPIELENIYKYLKNNVFTPTIPLLQDLLSDGTWIEKHQLLLGDLKETNANTQGDIDLSYKIKNSLKEEWKIQIGFDTFFDTLNYINKNTSRYINLDLTSKEIDLFFKNIKNNEILAWHFLHNYNTIFNYKEIYDNVFNKIIISGTSVDLILKLLLWVELYGMKEGGHNISAKILFNISYNYKEEFIRRRIAIILNENGNLKFDDNNLFIAILKNILDEKHSIVVEFASMFIEKYFSNFEYTQKEKILDLFYFEGEIKNSNALVQITKAENYYDKRVTFAYIKIVISNIKYNHKVVIKDLLKLLEVKYGKIAKISSYDLPAEPNFKEQVDIDRERNFKKSIFLILGKELLEISNNDKKLFIVIVNYIIDNACISFFIELVNYIIIQSDNEYEEIIEKLVKNKEIRDFIKISSKRWGENMYQFYLDKNSSYIDIYIEEIGELKKENEYIFIMFLSAIPKDKQSDKVKKIISAFEKEHTFKANFDDDKEHKVQFYGGSRELKVKPILKDGMNKKDFIKEITPIANERSFDIWDYSKMIEEFVKNNIYLVKETYESTFNINQELGSFIIKGFIVYLKEKYSNSSLEFYIELLYLYSIILDEDRHSKLEIGKLLDDNNYLRHLYTTKLKENSNETYKGLRDLIIDLSNNKDPEEDREGTSLDAGLTLGLNTVRGLGAICSCILLHYYPDDEKIKEVILNLSNDSLDGIQATVIYNSMYLLDKNYDFVIGYISTHKYDRNHSIDTIIVKSIFGKIYNKDIDENRDFFIELMKTGNKEIQNDLGNLLGSIVVNKIKGYDNIFSRLLKNEIGSTEMVKGLSFFMENHIPKLKIDDLEEGLDLFIQIINYEENNEEKVEDNRIIYRLSYLFYDNSLPIEFFPILKRKSIFDLIISKTTSGGVYNNINGYLLRILESGSYIDQVLDILLLEGNKNKELFTDPWATRDLGKILDILYKDFDGFNNIKTNKLFDKGLKYGNKDCYKIFDEYYKE